MKMTGKRSLLWMLVLTMSTALLAGCGGEKETSAADKTAGSPQNDSKQEAAAPQVPGEMYNTGEFMALVPEGWKGFPIADAFAEEADAVDPTCFLIIKDGTSDMDIFSKPYVRLDYYGPDTMMMKPDSSYYENVNDVAPMQLGSYSWSGFTGEDGYGGRTAVLWAEAGDIQYQATICLEIEGKQISVDDTDVLAILASAAPSDGSVNTAAPSGSGTVSADGNYDWWEKHWYGWWCIKNGTGIYEPASDIAWDAFAEIEVDNDNTGIVRFWDTGADKDQALIYAYTKYEPGTTDKGKLVTERVNFFPYGVWNNGMEAEEMDSDACTWVVDPAESTVSQFSDMIEITGYYESPSNPQDQFEYYIYLRPWGTLWDDVKNGDTAGCIYSDMMPLYYDNYYLPLLSLGYSEPISSFEEGIDILQAAASGNSGGGAAPDPAAKAGADGKVPLAALKEVLPWCKTETSYDTTYEEVAARIGVHGQQIESLFENKTIYRWSADSDNYIQITFDIHEDGSETWNVTTWNGLK